MRRSRALLVAAIVCLTTSAEASPQDVYGYGPRATAMGATGAAIGEGAETAWANPALLSLARTREFTLGFQASRLSLRADGNGLPGPMHAEPLKGTLVAAQIPLPFKSWLEHRVALGLAFYAPTDVLVRGRVLYPETPQFATLADRVQTFAMQAGLGVDVGYGVRVGAAVSALAGIAGTVLVATDTSGAVGTKVDDQLIATFGRIVGASYDLGDAYRIGVTYRSKLEARFAVLITVRDLGFDVPVFNIAGLAQYDPWQIQGEFARVKGKTRLAIGGTWKHWSSYPGAPEPTVLCPPEKPDCLALKTPPPGFKNTFVPRVGVEREVMADARFRLLGRAGYFFEPSPAPEQTGPANNFDNDRHAFTLGWAVATNDPWPAGRFEAFFQYHQLAARTHHKDPALVAPDAVGSPTAKTSGNVLFGGVAVTAKF